MLHFRVQVGLQTLNELLAGHQESRLLDGEFGQGAEQADLAYPVHFVLLVDERVILVLQGHSRLDQLPEFG